MTAKTAFAQDQQNSVSIDCPEDWGGSCSLPDFIGEAEASRATPSQPYVPILLLLHVDEDPDYYGRQFLVLQADLEEVKKLQAREPLPDIQ